LILVQPKAESVTYGEIFNSDMRDYCFGEDPELRGWRQYGKYRGKICILDYAHLDF